MINCYRCHKDLTQVSNKKRLKTDYGIVCVYCYTHYFKPKKVCPCCKKEKATVHKRSILKENPCYQGEVSLCNTCYAKIQGKHRTCKACGFPRLLNTDGVCETCATGEQIACKRCTKLMPLGRGNYCTICTKKNVFEKSIQKSIFVLVHDNLRHDYQEFATHLLECYDNITTLKEFTKYLPFFIACDEKWGVIPTYNELATYFGVNGLRTHLRVLRWLEISGRISVVKEIKEWASEQERIERLLTKFNPLPSIIGSYANSLQNQVDSNKITPKTMRLALQPVVDMFLMQNLGLGGIPTEQDFNQYLLVKAGQYNSLLKFVTFIRTTHNPNLSVSRPNQQKVKEIKQKSATAKRLATEKEMIKLLKKPQQGRTKHDLLKWLRCAMLLFQHKEISAKDTKRLELIKKDDTGELGLYRLDGVEYWLAIYQIM